MIKLEGIQGKEFKELLKVKYAISKDTTKPLLCGIHFYTKDNKLFSEAIDGYRAAQTHINFTYDYKIEFMIMEKEIKQINKLIKNDSILSITIDDREDTQNRINDLNNRIDDLTEEIQNNRKYGKDSLTLLDEQIKLLDEVLELEKYINYNHITINIDDDKIKCISLVCDNQFMQLDKLFYGKRNYDINKYNLNKKELLTALKELKKNMATVKNKLVKLNFYDSKLDITVKTKEGENNTITIPCKVEKPLEIAFNMKYLIDLLTPIDDKEITLKMTTFVNPIQIESTNMIQILLPVRFQKSNAA